MPDECRMNEFGKVKKKWFFAARGAGGGRSVLVDFAVKSGGFRVKIHAFLMKIHAFFTIFGDFFVIFHDFS